MEDDWQTGSNLDEREIEKLNEETNHLTNTNRFFPELVWEQVVSKLRAPTDVEASSLASPFFRKLLHSKRESLVLVPQVFELLYYDLMEEKEQDESNDGRDNNIRGPSVEIGGGEEDDLNMEIDNENREGAPANLADEVNVEKKNQKPIKDLLNCRLVSKSWNSAVEALFTHEEVGHYMMKFDMSNFDYGQLELNRTFNSVSELQAFMKHFDPTHYNLLENKVIKNPFLGRSVHYLQVEIPRNIRHQNLVYWNGILELFKKYGSEIWYFGIDLRSIRFDDSVELYNRLQSYLALLPNLKVLRLSYAGGGTYGMFQNDEAKSYIFRELAEAISRNQMPTLAKLEFMCLSNLPTPIFNEMIFKNRHVSQLQLDRKAYHDDYILFLLDLPKLTVISISIASLFQFKMLESCTFPLQLEKVYLWYDESAPFIPWSRIFQCLENKFGDSCEELLILVPLPKTEEEKTQVLEESHLCRLSLKKLERITIFDETPFCLDFLLSTKNTLTEISLRYNDINRYATARHLENQKFVDCRQLVQFVGFKEKMEESNIWKEFPQLDDFFLHRRLEMGGSLSYTTDPTENREKGFINIRKRTFD